MKKLAEYINNRYISLDGLDSQIIEKLSNLDGYAINECDCGCCCCKPDCYSEPYGCDCPCEVPSDATAIANPEPVVQDPVTQAKSKLYTQPKVYDLLNIHTLLDYKYRFMSEYRRALSEPVLFYDYFGVQYNDSEKLREDVMNLCTNFEFLWPVVLIKGDGTIQLFAAKKFGSNGLEGSIKSSLVSAADILTKLEKRKEINWAQVLDVSIDNLDDLYDFLFTVTFNKEKYDKELNIKSEMELKSLPTIPSIKL